MCIPHISISRFEPFILFSSESCFLLLESEKDKISTKDKIRKKVINKMNKIQSDLLAMNVSWFLEDLELYDGQYGFSESFCFTVARLVTLIMAIIVHRAFYKLMKRLPGRAVNQIIYPYMVRSLFDRDM